MKITIKTFVFVLELPMPAFGSLTAKKHPHGSGSAKWRIAAMNSGCDLGASTTPTGQELPLNNPATRAGFDMRDAGRIVILQSFGPKHRIWSSKASG